MCRSMRPVPVNGASKNTGAERPQPDALRLSEKFRLKYGKIKGKPPDQPTCNRIPGHFRYFGFPG